MIVIVEWHDAHTLGQEEVPAAESVARMHHGYLTRSAGFLVQSDETGVTLTTDVQRDGDDESHRHLHFVPRGMIVSEVTLPEQPTKRRKGRA